MAGVADKSGGPRKNAGGARVGAGRKPKAAPLPLPAIPTTDDPKTFLLGVMNDPVAESRERIDAAKTLMPFMHQKLGEGGKKQQTDDAAKKVASRFAPGAPPKLVATGGKQV